MTSTTTKVLGCTAILLAATGILLKQVFSKSSSRAIVEVDQDECIQPEDVIKVFDALFLHMQQVLAQLSQQVQQIQAAGQRIPEVQLRQLLKQEFERALLTRQPQVVEECDMDEDCFEQATHEFLAQPDIYPKVKRSVERFQKLYENVSGESVTSDSNSTSSDLTKDQLLQAAQTYFAALTEAMREIVSNYKGQDLNRMAQQIHLQFAQVANEAGEDALQSMGISLNDFRGAIEKYSGDPEVGRTLTMLQMQQQQELWRFMGRRSSHFRGCFHSDWSSAQQSAWIKGRSKSYVDEQCTRWRRRSRGSCRFVKSTMLHARFGAFTFQSRDCGRNVY